MTGSQSGLGSLFLESVVALTSARELDACERIFAETTAKFDIEVFACGEVDLSTPERVVMHVVHWPESWRKFYLSNGIASRDPLVEGLRKRRAPFTWSDMRADRTISAIGSEALREIAAHGWTEGLAVPIPRGETHFSLVSLVGRRGPFNDAERAFLSALAYVFHERVRLLAAHQDIAVSPSGMTNRERDALREIARGGTDADVAKALNVSTATAHEFVEKAKRRLKATSRAQAVALAIALAII